MRVTQGTSIAIIPARGGSQRIPRKNLREFAGRPMIAWSIAAAADSGCFGRIVVSTDDPQIAEAAVAAGAEAPFVRPAELSDAYTGTAAVVAHALDWLARTGGEAPGDGLACCLYATAPMVSAADIRRGRDALVASGAGFALAVSVFPAPVQRAMTEDERGRLRMMLPEYAGTRSQDLPKVFQDAGQFCWGRASAWASSLPVLASDCVPVLILRDRVIDIDTEEDWRTAERMFSALASTQG